MKSKLYQSLTIDQKINAKNSIKSIKDSLMKLANDTGVIWFFVKF